MYSRVLERPLSSVLWCAGQPRPFHQSNRSLFTCLQEAGLVAQEVEQIMPELVRQDSQGYKLVDYARLPLLTLQAVKELKAKNEATQLQISDQQAQIKTQQQLVKWQQTETKR